MQWYVGEPVYLHKRYIPQESTLQEKHCNIYLLVSFEANSQGQLAMVIYEWEDVKYLGKVTDPTDDTLPVSQHSVRVVISVHF